MKPDHTVIPTRSKKTRHLVEYAAARTLLVLLKAFPRLAFWLGRCAADTAFVLGTTRRRTAIDNLLAAGLARNRSQAGHIARQSFRHFAAVITECVLCSRHLTPENWRNMVEIDIPPETRQLLDDPGQGIILVSGHLGNWEIGGHLFSFFKPLTAVARRMNNPYTQRLFARYSARGRLTIIPKRHANPRQLVSAIRNGHGLGIMMDQHARDHAVKVMFFGRPAATYTTPARLHRLTGAPIVFQTVLRTGKLRYRLSMSEPLRYPTSGDPKADIENTLSDLTGRLERDIRTAPEQYLWAHRRWR